LSTSQYLGTGRRKTSTARVFLRPGTGVFTVNDKNIETYFFDEVHRMIAKQPLQISDTISKFDVVVSVAGGGMRGQAGAVQHGIARALVDYSAELRQILKKAGFLTRDPRMKERKKIRTAWSAKALPVLKAVVVLVASRDRLPAGDVFFVPA
jgi:small subunit ribosomal protein S9